VVFLIFLVFLTCAPAGAQEDGVLFSELDAAAPWLSAGAGVGTVADGLATQPLFRLQAAWWASPALSLDVTGALYPHFVPTGGPTYHLTVAGGDLTDRHDLLLGLAAAAFGTPTVAPGPRSPGRSAGVTPAAQVSLGYGYLGEDLDVRVTAAIIRGVDSLASDDFTATVSVSIGALIRSIRPGA
jgi:hypothetical protein